MSQDHVSVSYDSLFSTARQLQAVPIQIHVHKRNQNSAIGPKCEQLAHWGMQEGVYPRGRFRFSD